MKEVVPVIAPSSSFLVSKAVVTPFSVVEKPYLPSRLPEITLPTPTVRKLKDPDRSTALAVSFWSVIGTDVEG